MSKTIAITPSWYWPAGVPRVVGVPPYRVDELAVARWARRTPEAPALVVGDRRLSWSGLASEIESRSASLGGRVGVDVPTGDLYEGALTLLAGIAGGATLQLGGAAAPEQAPAGLRDSSLAVPAARGSAWLSQRALVAGTLGIGSFFGLAPQTSWVTAFPLNSWKGLYGLVAPLVAGATVVLSEPGPAALDAVRRESASWLFADLGDAFAWSRDAKREVKALRAMLNAALLCVDGPFDSEQRRRVGRLFECPALTLYGLPETGPIFGSHVSWYIDESAGIPLTNLHVVPADPRTGTPISTLWELVESAMVTVSGPSLFNGYAGGVEAAWLPDGRFSTGVIASSDPNGMVYILPG